MDDAVTPVSPQTLFISNPVAGSVAEEVVEQVTAVLAGGFDLRAVHPTTPEALRHLLADHEGDRVVIAGGDGSLHLLINQLADAGRLDGVAVGLIPMGTGNDFATGAGVPHDPLEAARRCLDGAPVPVDAVVADDGEYVVNAAHAGIGAVAAERAQGAKAVAGRLAYPLGAIVAALSETGYPATLTLDDEVIHDGMMLFAMAANGPCIGGGVAMSPGADPTDGLLDVLVFDAIPTAERVGLGLDIQRGTHLRRDDVHHRRGHRLTIDGTDIDHNRDGELRHGLDDVTYRVRPAAWRLLR